MAEPLTVNDLELYYSSMKGDKLSNQKTYRSNVRNVLEYFGDMEPKDIGPSESQKYTDLRRAGKIGNAVGDGTIIRELGVLSAICHFAARYRVIPKSDVPSLDRPKMPKAKDRWLTETELVRMMQAAVRLREGSAISRIERFLWIAIMTAARFDAILRLKWYQIDFETEVVHLDPEITPSKRSKKRKASVAMTEELRIILQQAFNERESEYVLTNTRDIRGDFAKVMKLAGLENVTPHTIRHTAATHMARRGVELWRIAKVLGNTLATVEKTYAHHCPRDTVDAVAKIPSPIGGKHDK